MKIPFWIVSSLGAKVQLSKPYSDGLRVYQAGTTGTLISIQAGTKGAYATVTLDADNTAAEENFRFNQLRPAQ